MGIFDLLWPKGSNTQGASDNENMVNDSSAGIIVENDDSSSVVSFVSAKSEISDGSLLLEGDEPPLAECTKRSTLRQTTALTEPAKSIVPCGCTSNAQNVKFGASFPSDCTSLVEIPLGLQPRKSARDIGKILFRNESKKVQAKLLARTNSLAAHNPKPEKKSDSRSSKWQTNAQHKNNNLYRHNGTVSKNEKKQNISRGLDTTHESKAIIQLDEAKVNASKPQLEKPLVTGDQDPLSTKSQTRISPLKSKKRYSVPRKVLGTEVFAGHSNELKSERATYPSTINNSADTSVRNAMQEILNASDFADARRRVNSIDRSSSSSSMDSERREERGDRENGVVQRNTFDSPYRKVPFAESQNWDYDYYDSYKPQYQKIQTPEQTRRYLKQMQLREEEERRKEFEHRAKKNTKPRRGRSPTPRIKKCFGQRRGILPPPSNASTAPPMDIYTTHVTEIPLTATNDNEYRTVGSKSNELFSPLVGSATHKSSRGGGTKANALTTANSALITANATPWNLKTTNHHQNHPWETEKMFQNIDMDPSTLPIADQRSLALAAACLTARPANTKRYSANVSNSFLLDDSLDADELALLVPPPEKNHSASIAYRRASLASNTSGASSNYNGKTYDFALLEGVRTLHVDDDLRQNPEHQSDESVNDILPWGTTAGKTSNESNNRPSQQRNARSSAKALGEGGSSYWRTSFRSALMSSPQLSHSSRATLCISRVSSIEGDSSLNSGHTLSITTNGGEKVPSSLWFGKTDSWMEQVVQQQAIQGLNAVQSATETQDENEARTASPPVDSKSANKAVNEGFVGASREPYIVNMTTKENATSNEPEQPRRLLDKSGIVSSRAAFEETDPRPDCLNESGIMASRNDTSFDASDYNEGHFSDDEEEDDVDLYDGLLLQRKFQNQIQSKQERQSDLDDELDAELLQRKFQNQALAEEETHDSNLLRRKYENQRRSLDLKKEEALDSELLRRKNQNQAQRMQLPTTASFVGATDTPLTQNQHNSSRSSETKKTPNSTNFLIENLEAKKSELHKMMLSPSPQQLFGVQPDDDRDDILDEQLLQRKRTFQRERMERREDAEEEALLQRKRANQRLAAAKKRTEQMDNRNQEKSVIERNLDLSFEDESGGDAALLQRKRRWQRSSHFKEAQLRGLIKRLQENTVLVRATEAASEDLYNSEKPLLGNFLESGAKVSNEQPLQLVRPRFDGSEGILSGFSSSVKKLDLGRKLKKIAAATENGSEGINNEALDFIASIVLSSPVKTALNSDLQKEWIEKSDARARLGLQEGESVLSHSLESTLSSIPTSESTEILTQPSSSPLSFRVAPTSLKHVLVICTSMLQHLSTALEDLRQSGDAPSGVEDSIGIRLCRCYDQLLSLRAVDVLALNGLFTERMNAPSLGQQNSLQNATDHENVTYVQNDRALQRTSSLLSYTQSTAADESYNQDSAAEHSPSIRRQESILQGSESNSSLLQSPQGPVWLPGLAATFTEEKAPFTPGEISNLGESIEKSMDSYSADATEDDDEVTNVQDVSYGSGLSDSLSESRDYTLVNTSSLKSSDSPNIDDKRTSYKSFDASSAVSSIRSEHFYHSILDSNVGTAHGSQQTDHCLDSSKIGIVGTNSEETMVGDGGTGTQNRTANDIEITATESKETVVESLSPIGARDEYFLDDTNENQAGDKNNSRKAVAFSDGAKFLATSEGPVESSTKKSAALVSVAKSSKIKTEKGDCPTLPAVRPILGNR